MYVEDGKYDAVCWVQRSQLSSVLIVLDTPMTDSLFLVVDAILAMSKISLHTSKV